MISWSPQDRQCLHTIANHVHQESVSVVSSPSIRNTNLDLAELMTTAFLW